MQIDTSMRARICAVLGPTNTGKTFLALERMMAHGSGMIGFPLRLLARENYDRVVEMKGPGQVALITGEEKILPPHARYFLCTVESMPVEREVDFLAIDEIQLCSDPDRGHVFTDRLLNARGRHETMFMGAQTIAPLLRRLVPDAEFETRPRFSKLTYSGSKKLTRLPNRSAIVAFSAAEVYAIAELIRRQKGGAAVVLGALSPRTRNAQVDLYQEGEVDYIVATDAIGMGLNMDVDHVAFAALSKFDGYNMRRLNPQEMAQIAGRAGRHMRDGTFGVTGDCPLISPEVLERIEGHEFENIERVYWRNSRLRFGSVEMLLSDLKQKPQTQGLNRPFRTPEDERTLEFLSKHADIMDLARDPKGVRQLWEVCQVPDFAKSMTDTHPRLLGQIFKHLRDFKGLLPTDWVAGHVTRLDRVDGDIDTLTQRLANIRTWTYISHRANWLQDPSHWQGITRGIEDKISDALHQQLTKRFVDRRTSTLMRRLKDKEDLLAAISKTGEVLVEGHYVGRLEGFHFRADEVEGSHARRAVESAALKALRGEMDNRIDQLEQDDPKHIKLAANGFISWNGVSIARLVKGREVLTPLVKTLRHDLLEEEQRNRIETCLTKWLGRYLRKHFTALNPSGAFEKQSAAVRGILFQLCEGMGTLVRRQVQQLVEQLLPPERRYLRKIGVEIGRYYIFIPKLQKGRGVSLRLCLYRVFHAQEVSHELLQAAPMSLVVPKGLPDGFLTHVGYALFGPLAIRIDILERFAATAWENVGKKELKIDGSLSALIGASNEKAAGVLQALGYFIEKREDGFWVKKSRKLHHKIKTPDKKAKPQKQKDLMARKLEQLKKRYDD